MQLSDLLDYLPQGLTLNLWYTNDIIPPIYGSEVSATASELLNSYIYRRYLDLYIDLIEPEDEFTLNITLRIN